jgi:hypothetical protein
VQQHKPSSRQRNDRWHTCQQRNYSHECRSRSTLGTQQAQHRSRCLRLSLHDEFALSSQGGSKGPIHGVTDPPIYAYMHAIGYQCVYTCRLREPCRTSVHSVRMHRTYAYCPNPYRTARPSLHAPHNPQQRRTATNALKITHVPVQQTRLAIAAVASVWQPGTGGDGSAQLYMHIYVCIHTFTCICICICMCLWMCKYIYIDPLRDAARVLANTALSVHKSGAFRGFGGIEGAWLTAWKCRR